MFTDSFSRTQFQDYYYQENLLLGEYDVCLSNVDSLYLSSSDKKRKLLPGNTAPDKVKRLCVFCKVSTPSRLFVNPDSGF